MIILSKFAERLDELMFDSGTKRSALAKAIGVHRTTVGQYINGNCFPSVKSLVAIADYFNCSADYLLGASNYNNSKFKECPPFSEQFEFLLNHFNKTKYQVKKYASIPESIIYQWRDGIYAPTVENVAKLAEYFGCSIDFVLGREA